MNTLQITNGKVISIPKSPESTDVGKVVKRLRGPYEINGVINTFNIYYYLLGIENKASKKTYHFSVVLTCVETEQMVLRFEDYNEEEYLLKFDKTSTNGT